MTTSASTNFSLSRNEVIIAALKTIRVLGEDETPSSAMLSTAATALNILVKSFENHSRHVWKKTECTLFLQADQYRYKLGVGSTDHCTESFIETAVTTTVSSGTSLVVTSTTGMTAGDYIGVTLDDGTLFWTTITTVTDSTTLVLASAITSIATAANVVFSYTTKVFKPLEIYGIRRYNISADTEVNVKEVSYNEYMKFPSKTTSALPIAYTYNRQASYGYLYVWSPPSDVTSYLNITYSVSFDDFDSTSDTPDFPQEWYRTLVLGLASDLSHIYGKATGESYQALMASYGQSLREALAYDVEGTYLTLKPGNK